MGGARPVWPWPDRGCAGDRLPPGARCRARFGHADLRGVEGAARQLALAGRAVLPALGQAYGPQADRDRGALQTHATSDVSTDTRARARQHIGFQPAARGGHLADLRCQTADPGDTYARGRYAL